MGAVIMFSGCVRAPEVPASPIPTNTQTLETPMVTQEAPISTWYQVYGKGKENSGSDLVLTQDGGTLIVGGIGHFEENDRIGGVMLLRTNEKGELLWQQIYGGDGYDFGSAIVETPDGGYLIAGATTSYGKGGSDGYVIGIDKAGNFLWANTFGGVLNEFINCILPIQEAGYFLIGNVEDPNDFITDPGVAGYGGFAGRSNIYIVRLDQKGNQVWDKVIESESNIMSTDAILSLDGSILVLATVIKYPEPDNDFVLFSFDAGGNQIWAKTWEEGDISGYAMAQDRSGNILISGLISGDDNLSADAFLLKLDPEGNELWLKKFGLSSQYAIARDVVVMTDGKYAVLTQKTPSFFTPDISNSIQIIDSDGTLLLESEIELVEFEYSLKTGSLHNHPGGGLIIVGAGTGIDGEFKTMLIRTDAEGSIH
jgi:hypothetical protein